MYKEYEPEYLIKFYNNHKDFEDIVDQITNITSKLILIQALPNANHRTAFIFIRIYLKKLFNEIIELPQSGMVTLESLHSFIASLNQSGSSPSENQQGSN